MKITQDQLRAWGASADLLAWFLATFPAGEADYQATLDALADADMPADANWLMNHAGADGEAVLKAEVIDGRKHLFFAGCVEVAGAISVRGTLRAGLGIKAGLGIEAGWGFGVFAGLRVRLGRWAQDAVVRAQGKPANLISGHWSGK